MSFPQKQAVTYYHDHQLDSPLNSSELEDIMHTIQKLEYNKQGHRKQTLAIIVIVALKEEKSLQKSEAYSNCPSFIHCHSVVPFPPNRVKPVFIPMVLDP